MAYAQLAGLPPITGLYTTIACLLAYAVFGPSRILVLGPDSSLGPDDRRHDPPAGRRARRSRPGRGAGVDARAHGRPSIMIVAGWAGLGFVADLLSKPTMIGYMNGLALTIIVGQLPKLFGFSIDADGLIGEIAAFVRGWRTARWSRRPPRSAWRHRADPGAAALAAEGARGAGHGGAGHRRHRRARTWATRGVALIGELPKGFPPLTWPRVGWSDVGPLVAGAAAIALVVPGRHHLHRVVLRRAQRPGRARQPGDDRHRRGQPRRGAVPGFPGQHQRLPHRRRRARRVPDAAHRGHRRGADHRDDRVRARAVPEPARSPRWPRW